MEIENYCILLNCDELTSRDSKLYEMYIRNIFHKVFIGTYLVNSISFRNFTGANQIKLKDDESINDASHSLYNSLYDEFSRSSYYGRSSMAINCSRKSTKLIDVSNKAQVEEYFDTDFSNLGGIKDAKANIKLGSWGSNFTNNYITNYKNDFSIYSRFFIPKKEKGKLRLITAPKQYLKECQRNLNEHIYKTITPQNPNILAYAPGSDYVKSLDDKELNYEAMVNFDVKNFFHQITGASLDKALGNLLVKQLERDCKISLFMTDVGPVNLLSLLTNFINSEISELDAMSIKDVEDSDLFVALWNSSRTLLEFAKLLFESTDLRFLEFESTKESLLNNITSILVIEKLINNISATDPKAFFSGSFINTSELQNYRHSCIDSFKEGFNLSLKCNQITLPSNDIGSLSNVNQLIYILLKKFKSCITTKIPVNYESQVKSVPISREEFNDMAISVVDGEEGNSLKTMSEFVRETGERPQFYKFVKKYGKRLNWSTSLPQGAPTSGTIVNLFNDLLYKALKEKLEGNDLIAKFELFIYSDNIYVFYNVNPNIKDQEFMVASFISKEVNKVCKDYNLTLNKEKEMFFSKRDKKMLGLLINKEGDVRVSRQTRRMINQIIINLNKKESIMYKGMTYTRENLSRLKGLINWLNRTDNKGYNRLLIPMEF